MGFIEAIEIARAFLERNGRVSLRAQHREFELDGDALEDLVEEVGPSRSSRSDGPHGRAGPYGWSLSAFGSLARAQLALGEAAFGVESTLHAYAAAIQHTGMCVFGRELAELRTAIQERTR